MVSIRNRMTLLSLIGVMVVVTAWGTVDAQSTTDQAFPTVGAVSKTPTHTSLPGKAIWVDLVTTDVRGAASFYSSVFGWEFSYLANGTFAEASYQGRPVGSITVYEEGEAVAGDAQWLVSFSAPDIDGAVKKVIKAGGKVLEGPNDLDGRGRFVLISDPAGAELMLLNATGGDPVDGPAKVNEWLWAELWTPDTAAAGDFYAAVLGHQSMTIDEPSGEPYMVLARDRVARAGVVKLFFEDVEPNWVPYILVESVKDTIESIERHGGQLVMAPGENASEVSTAIVSDPTGGVFAIQQRGN